MKCYKYILLILMLVKINALTNNDVWFRQESNTMKDLNDVFFINADTGWVVGQDGTILNTVNGGDQWNIQTSGTDADLYGVHFINSDVGYAVGFNRTILKTENSGDSWEIKTSGTSMFLFSVYFIHPDTGWVCGEYGLITKTVNGGDSWSDQSTPVETRISSIQFIDSKNGWAVGTGNVLNTADGGDNWNIIPTNVPTVDWWDLCCIDKVHIWIGSHNDGVYNSMNGGSSWNYKGEGAYLYFITNDVGWTSYGHTIYSTVDCGNHWGSYTFDFFSPLYIYFVTTKTGWIVGEGGRIYKTTIGGVVTNIEDRYNMNKPDEFMLMQNYPNPFNPTTTIVFDLPKTSEVTLKILNILGEEVATLVSDRLAAGSYSYDWSRPAGMASGVYLYRMEAGEFVDTKKMILMR